MIWLIRMAQWARRPPSARRAALVAGVVAACLLLVAVERWIGWPEALRLDRAGPPAAGRPGP
jgi:hypothetical protein